MKRIQCFLFLALLATQHTVRGQGTLTITFDEPPVPTGQTVVSSYVESGMRFEGIVGFGRFASGFQPGFPDDGTAYLHGAGHAGYNDVYGSFIDGSTFGVSSIDLAASGGNSTEISAVFEGWFANGTVLTETVSGTGIDFRTVDFGPEWSSGLTAFGISNDQSSPDGWSVDTLVVVVPEPASGALLLAGGVAGLAFRKLKRR
ncbi:MAG TPA: PEP-CTERM sorting domain-containing protein [Verrucomicrobiae bacterium]|jgi:hypothetical protein|nr:PEP-CTERM sorting domain-containing protein [Verrucomicrobiae bacterium]